MRREVPEGNRRSFTIVLTPEGEQTFESVFPAHVTYLKQRFGKLSNRELEQIQVALQKLRQLF